MSWKAIRTPGLTDRKVQEIGGFKPFLQLNPPAAELPALADKHADFLARLLDWLPAIEDQTRQSGTIGRRRLFRLWFKSSTPVCSPTQPAMAKTAQHTDQVANQARLARKRDACALAMPASGWIPSLATAAPAEKSWVLRSAGRQGGNHLKITATRRRWVRQQQRRN